MQVVSNQNIHISVVIPVYNGAEFLKKCLPALVETADEQTEIILVYCRMSRYAS